jgi:hypothetical protein
VTTPVIDGWISQWYVYRPAWWKVAVYESPIWRIALPPKPPLSGVTVCGSEPASLRFVQVTLSPTWIVTLPGMNAQSVVPVFLMETAAEAPSATGTTTASRIASGTRSSRPRTAVT